MPRKKTEPPPSDVSLHIGPSVSATWKNLVLPWFERIALTSVATESPSAVTVPSRAYASFLRRQLLGNQVSLLGVRFFTPPQLRQLLLRDCDLQLPLPEDLRLLL